ncbi:fimbrial adhesin EcpD [Klebsiella aerogenes]
MKNHYLIVCFIFSAGLFFTPHANSTNHDIDQPTIFIENNIDNDYLVIAVLNEIGYGAVAGSNRWNQLKGEQTRLGSVISWGGSGADHLSDMWIPDTPVSFPLLGQGCSITISGCNTETGINPPQSIDSIGFYESRFNKEDTGLVGVMSEAFYQYLRTMTVGNSFSMQVYACSDLYVNAKYYGGTCKNRTSRYMMVQKFKINKIAHLKLINTNAIDEVFVNSDGKPTPAEDNMNCKIQKIGNQSGLACKMVSYSLQSNGQDLSLARFYPYMINSSLASTISTSDMQVSLDGSSWKPTPAKSDIYAKTFNSYTLEEMKSSESLYVFFSENFFKQMVILGLGNVNSRDVFSFRIYSGPSRTPYTSYAFTTSNSLEIKPREFSINISAEDYSDAPSREGYVGRDEPSLDFNYIVTTSGKTAADEVLIKATGPTQQINGRAHCIFSADDGSIKVPFPAMLSFTKQDGSINTYDVGCDGSWRDMTDALWLTSAWTDISGEAGVMDKATVKFSIPMNDDISQKTLDNNEWYGDVSASGEIHVQATWRDIN